MSRPTLKSTIRQMESAGCIVVDVTPGKPNTYTLVPEAIEAYGGQIFTQVRGVDIRVTRGANSLPPQANSASPQLSESSLTPPPEKKVSPDSQKSLTRPKKNLPELLEPLTSLAGWQNLKDYDPSVMEIERVSEIVGVEPTDVIAEFVHYYPTGRSEHGWKSPLRSLVNTIHVQAGKVSAMRNGTRSQPPPRGDPLGGSNSVSGQRKNEGLNEELRTGTTAGGGKADGSVGDPDSWDIGPRT